MYETTRTTHALAIALLFAPVLGHAADSSPSSPASGNSSTLTSAAVAKAGLPQSLSALKGD
ncbi:MAG: hypothetical protein EOO78_04280, partial [Oxalobacteraceae bacterium]